jgi:hypothetical protein
MAGSFVTCAAPESSIVIIDTAKAGVKTIAAGHTAMAPVLVPTAKRSSSDLQQRGRVH